MVSRSFYESLIDGVVTFGKGKARRQCQQHYCHHTEYASLIYLELSHSSNRLIRFDHLLVKNGGQIYW